MDWQTYHRKSEEHAARAHEHLRFGEHAAALEEFRLAAESEQAALSTLDISKPRTLGITAVSAVSLLYKAKAFESAALLAHRYLGMAELTEAAREQLDDLVVTLYNERDKKLMAGEFLPGSVTVAVRGGEVLRGAAPLELITEKVKTLQAIFYRVVEWQSNVPLRRRGGPARNILNAFEPWLVQEAPGSFQFSVAVKVTGQKDMFTAEQLEAADIAKKFLDVVTTMAADTTGEPSRELVPDAEYRSTFRKLVRNLTPPPGSSESIVITSKEREDTAAVLDETTRPRLDIALREEQPKANEAAGETAVEFVGVLRALDLDKDWLKVEMDAKLVTVKGLSQTVDDVIGPLVNRKVLVKALKPKRGDLKFVDIELAA